MHLDHQLVVTEQQQTVLTEHVQGAGHSSKCIMCMNPQNNLGDGVVIIPSGEALKPNEWVWILAQPAALSTLLNLSVLRGSYL